jgi:hypothetical protein
MAAQGLLRVYLGTIMAAYAVLRVCLSRIMAAHALLRHHLVSSYLLKMTIIVLYYIPTLYMSRYPGQIHHKRGSDSGPLNALKEGSLNIYSIYYIYLFLNVNKLSNPLAKFNLI